MKPWDIEVFGGTRFIGACTHVIATPDKRVRLTVWSPGGQGTNGYREILPSLSRRPHQRRL